MVLAFELRSGVFFLLSEVVMVVMVVVVGIKTRWRGAYQQEQQLGAEGPVIVHPSRCPLTCR